MADVAQPLTWTHWSAALQPLPAQMGQVVLQADGVATEAAAALQQVLLSGEQLARAGVDVGLVADELRRYQKFAAPGRPSLQIVQLRRQQSGVQQAQRVARQAHIRCADQFARVIGLEVPAKLGVVAAVERWLQAHLPG